MRSPLGPPVASTARVTTELVVVETAGDLHRDRPIGAIGGRGAFVTEVEQALIDGRAELAVHSAKDLPSSCGSGELEIVAVPKGPIPGTRSWAGRSPSSAREHASQQVLPEGGPSSPGSGQICVLRN